MINKKIRRYLVDGDFVGRFNSKYADLTPGFQAYIPLPRVPLLLMKNSNLDHQILRQHLWNLPEINFLMKLISLSGTAFYISVLKILLYNKLSLSIFNFLVQIRFQIRCNYNLILITHSCMVGINSGLSTAVKHYLLDNKCYLISEVEARSAYAPITVPIIRSSIKNKCFIEEPYLRTASDIYNFEHKNKLSIDDFKEQIKLIFSSYKKRSMNSLSIGQWISNQREILDPELQSDQGLLSRFKLLIFELIQKIRSDSLKKQMSLCMIHGDYKLEQIVVCSDGPRVLDWEFCRMSSPACDYVSMIYSFDDMKSVLSTKSKSDSYETLFKELALNNGLNPDLSLKEMIVIYYIDLFSLASQIAYDYRITEAELIKGHISRLNRIKELI